MNKIQIPLHEEKSFDLILHLTKNSKKLTRNRRNLNSVTLDVLKNNNSSSSNFFVSMTSEIKFLCYDLAESTSTTKTTLNISGGKPFSHRVNKYFPDRKEKEKEKNEDDTTEDPEEEKNVSSKEKEKEKKDEEDEEGVEYAVGFESGDVLLSNPLKNNHRFKNKTGRMISSCVTSIEWLNENLFITSHQCGMVVLFNKNFNDNLDMENIDSETFKNQQKSNKKEDDGEKDYFVWENTYEDPEKSKTNPLVIINVCESQVNEIKLSPNREYLACCCGDGYIRIIKYHTKELIFKLQSFFSPFTCCSWSSDGRYIVGGSEDDLISIFDLKKKILVCRGIGHKSFLRKVQFDHYEEKENKKRIVSVGDDGLLIFWDFFCSENDITPNKKTDSKQNEDNDSAIDDENEKTPLIEIKTPKFKKTPFFEPLLIFKGHETPIRDCKIFKEGLLTVSNEYKIKLYSRDKYTNVLKNQIANESESDDDSSSEEERNPKKSSSHQKKTTSDNVSGTNRSRSNSNRERRDRGVANRLKGALSWFGDKLFGTGIDSF